MFALVKGIINGIRKIRCYCLRQSLRIGDLSEKERKKDAFIFVYKDKQLILALEFRFNIKGQRIT
jgi:hypothetical protein